MNAAALPPYVGRDLVEQRLALVFPDGTPNRNNCVRGAAASAVFTMLYVGAVDGTERWVSPKFVYRMTEEQACQVADSDRIAYSTEILRPGFAPAGTRWYADNSREQIRDEALRGGLALVGALVEKADVPVTSAAPRWALQRDFAGLFDPALVGTQLDQAITAWQGAHLSAGALARVRIMKAGAAAQGNPVMVTFPNNTTTQLEPGPSSIIIKEVIEQFAPRYLRTPAVLWLSQSGSKVLPALNALAKTIGLNIEPSKNLPDIILADVGGSEPIVVFVEVVATDGAITPARQEALWALTDGAGFKRSNVAFVTAYTDREASAGVTKTFRALAWQSFAWFASEPDQIVIMREGVSARATIGELMDIL